MNNKRKIEMFEDIERHINKGWMLGVSPSGKIGKLAIDEYREAVEQYNKEHKVKVFMQVSKDQNIQFTSF